jgi:uncharacterized protein (DUF2249 family)
MENAEITTRVVVNITRHETCIYELEGTLSVGEALEIIESGEEPDESNIHSEDIDVVDLEHVR